MLIRGLNDGDESLGAVAEFAGRLDRQEDLLSITAVHPMRRDAVEALLEKARADWSVVEALIAGDRLVESQCGGRKYYLRRSPRNSELAGPPG
jgi:hypothetical protein